MNKKKLKSIFKSNPAKKEIHITSDGYTFWANGYAQGHASGLVDKTVTTVKRTDVFEPDEDVEEAALIAAQKAKEAEEEKLIFDAEKQAQADADEALLKLATKAEEAKEATAPEVKETETSEAAKAPAKKSNSKTKK
ncbi:MAG: hypothetical protein H0X62_05925 [Bacteroidetes bacterium]|nr:hypothetical protein [Bacteroidota bacterium]